MTTDSVFILFKKTDFKTILVWLGGKVYRWLGDIVTFVAGIWVAILLTLTFCKFGNPSFYILAQMTKSNKKQHQEAIPLCRPKICQYLSSLDKVNSP